MTGLMNYSEAAKYLGLSVVSVRVLVRHGKVTLYRIGPNGGTPRFKAEDLDKYVESCRKVGSNRR